MLTNLRKLKRKIKGFLKLSFSESTTKWLYLKLSYSSSFHSLFSHQQALKFAVFHVGINWFVSLSVSATNPVVVAISGSISHARTKPKLSFRFHFPVVNIDYLFQSIWLNDPDHCTPKRLLHGLNLSSTPFDLLYPRSFTFFNCSAAASTQVHQAKYISCLSGTNFSVVALPTDRHDSPASLSTSCIEIATVLVPFYWRGWSNVGNNIMLAWKESDCLWCENGAGNCMFKSETGLDVGCSGGFANGMFLFCTVKWL